MLTLHGFAISNYYNKVKLALLEKNEGPAREQGLVFQSIVRELFLPFTQHVTQSIRRHDKEYSL